MIQAEENNTVVQLERFINFNRLMNTGACLQRALSKYKPKALAVSIEEREKAKLTIFKLLQLEQFRKEMKSLKAEKKILKRNKI